MLVNSMMYNSKINNTNLSKDNIEGIIIDTQDTMKFSGDFEWINNVNNNGYITSGYSIIIPYTRELNKKKDIHMGNSVNYKVDKLMSELSDFYIIGRANKPEDVVTLVKKYN